MAGPRVDVSVASLPVAALAPAPGAAEESESDEEESDDEEASSSSSEEESSSPCNYE